MDELFRQIPALLAPGLSFIVLASLFWWKADDLISKAGKEQLVKLISGYSAADYDSVLASLSAMLDRYLPWRTDIATYLVNVLLISSLSTLAVGIIYFSKVGGFWMQLSSGESTSTNFVSQLVFDGLLKVYLVNLVGLIPHSFYIYSLRRLGPLRSLGVLFIDIVTRELLFIALSAVIWIGFTIIFGSFTGSVALSLQSIVPTFSDAGYFRNLTSVYVYSVAATSLPLIVAVLVRMLGASPASQTIIKSSMFWLPWAEKPVRSLIVLAAALMALFAVISSLLLSPFA